MSAYEFSLGIHLACAGATLLFFFLRGIWMINASSLLEAPFTRIAPHVIDSILLLAAVALTLQINQYPLVNAWLTVKLVAMVAYILLGTIALKRGKTKKQRVIAFILALATFAFIVSVARLHHPLGLFTVLT